MGEEEKEKKKEEIKRMIRKLIEIRYDVQDVRKRSFSRLKSVGEVEGIEPRLLKKLEEQIRKKVDLLVKESFGDEKILEWLRSIRGLGPIMAGGLLAYFDIKRSKHVSSFWKYAGLHVEDGFAPRMRKGTKVGFNPKAHWFMWLVGGQLLKFKNPVYVPIYEDAKIREEMKLHYPTKDPKNCPLYEPCKRALEEAAKRKGRKPKPPPCKLHIHQRALRKMEKEFLKDFWLKWRQFSGLPISEPYWEWKTKGGGGTQGGNKQ